MLQWWTTWFTIFVDYQSLHFFYLIYQSSCIFYPSTRVVLLSKINSSSSTTKPVCSHCLHSQLYSPAFLSATTLNACWAQQKLPSPFSCFTNQSQTLCCYCTACCTLDIRPSCTPCSAAHQTLLCMLAPLQPAPPMFLFCSQYMEIAPTVK